MKTRLNPGSSAGEQLQARCLEELAEAIGQLRGPGELAPRVHEARKSMKKLRGTLRLWRGALPEFVYRTENACFREAALALAERRAEAALLECLEALRHSLESEARRSEWVSAEPLFVPGDRAEHAAPDPRELLDGVAAELERAKLRIAGWTGEAWLTQKGGWALVEAGLSQTYVLGRKRLRRSLEDACTETLHEWRKVVKYQMYQLDALASLWPALIDTWRAQLKDLSDILGDDHDLAELEQLVLVRVDDLELRFRLSTDIEHRRRELRLRAHELGTRLYAEKPRSLMHRLRHYFETWAGKAA